MRRHGPVIAHCTDSEDFPNYVLTLAGSTAAKMINFLTADLAVYTEISSSSQNCAMAVTERVAR